METFTTKIITTYKTKRNKNKQRIAQKSMKKLPMKKKDHIPYTNIVGKKKKKKSNGIDSVQPQKNMFIYFDRLHSHFGIGSLIKNYAIHISFL